MNSITGKPVDDETGLTGKYDFTLTFSPEADAANRPADDSSAEPFASDGLTVFAALEKQLGLKLVSKKSPVELFVIDHAEKTPVEN